MTLLFIHLIDNVYIFTGIGNDKRIAFHRHAFGRRLLGRVLRKKNNRYRRKVRVKARDRTW